MELKRLDHDFTVCKVKSISDIDLLQKHNAFLRSEHKR